MANIICVTCRKQMQCIKNGIGLDYGYGHVYPSDIYQCNECKTVISYANSNPIHDNEYKTQDAYIVMPENKYAPENYCQIEKQYDVDKN